MTIKLVGAYIKQIGQENKSLLYHNGSKNAQEKKLINNSKRKSQITYEIIPNRIRLDFSKETKILKTLKTLKNQKRQPNLLYLRKLSIAISEESTAFHV